MKYLLYHLENKQLAIPMLYDDYEIAAAAADQWFDDVSVLELQVPEDNDELPEPNISQTFHPGP